MKVAVTGLTNKEEKALQELTQRLLKAYQNRLVSVILYGSAASGDYQQGYSDLNVLCVLEQLGLEELRRAGPILRWWRELGSPSPLLLTLEELRNSTDCFPIEFHDIRDRHRVLYGQDVVADLEIDDVFYRAHVEFELRAKLLRLRQKAAAVMEDGDLLRELLLQSVSTFCVLMRHALRLHGIQPGYLKREVVEAAENAFQLNLDSFKTLLDLREGIKKSKEVDPRQLFSDYIAAISAIAQAVDRLER